jgi:hypothetical protein
LALLYKTKLFNLTGSRALSEETIDVYWELRNLSRLKEDAAIQLEEGEVIKNIPFSDTVEYLEHRAVPLAQLEPISRPSQNLAIYILFGYASLVHMFIFMRDMSKDLPFCYLLSSRIRLVLEKVDSEKLRRQYPEMMLWILIVAGLSGSPSSERGWFAKCVADFCLELGLRGGNQVTSMLEVFMWSELYRSPVTQGFWAAVARAQGVEKGYEVRRLADRVSLSMYNKMPDVQLSVV